MKLIKELYIFCSLSIISVSMWKSIELIVLNNVNKNLIDTIMFIIVVLVLYKILCIK